MVGKQTSRGTFADMGHKKLVRFEEIKGFRNVFEYPSDMAGNWNSFFENDHPIVLELACGKGEYATGLAKLYPDKNFIGVDVKGNRIWVGAKHALNNELRNVAFIRSQIDKIENYFDNSEISEIWITFPDPFLRLSKLKKRLTHPKFLRMYSAFLQNQGVIHLKTDSPVLYRFTKKVAEMYSLNVVKDTSNLYQSADFEEARSIQTYYEGLNISGSNRIYYIAFTLPDKIEDHDEELKSYFFTEKETAKDEQAS